MASIVGERYHERDDHGARRRQLHFAQDLLVRYAGEGVGRHGVVEDFVVDKEDGQRVAHDVTVAEVADPSDRGPGGIHGAAEADPHNVVSLVIDV